jgi:hypothetical protein
MQPLALPCRDELHLVTRHKIPGHYYIMRSPRLLVYVVTHYRHCSNRLSIFRPGSSQVARNEMQPHYQGLTPPKSGEGARVDGELGGETPHCCDLDREVD